MSSTRAKVTGIAGAMIRQIAEHNHYVQGVAWDPLNEFVATQSADRTVHIYALKLKDGTCTLSTHGRFNRMDLPGRRVSTQSPAPAELSHRASTTSAGGLAIASPAPSNPGTPMATPLPMDPPLTASSRRSSFGSSPAFRRSASPAPSLPLPAVRSEISSPSLNAAMGLAVRNTNIYHNETFNSFFRRLTFAPDGSLLLTPSGQYKSVYHLPHGDLAKPSEDISNTVYIYTRAGFNKPPVAHLPGHKKPSVAVRCSPIFYTLRNHIKPTSQITIDTSQSEEIAALPEAAIVSNSHAFMEPPPPLSHSESARSDSGRPTSSPKPGEADVVLPAPPAFSLPYRMVYAVATQDAILVYDTQQTIPLCVVSNLHYATFTDLAWSNDGLTLLMSSSDGFCSALTFVAGELGTVYTGLHPTHSYPHQIVSTSLPAPFPREHTPLGTPTAASPGLSKVFPAPPAAPSPAPSSTTFQVRPGSPTRSNSQSSIATMASLQAPPPGNMPTPVLSSIPMVAIPSMTTPPQTPMGMGEHQPGYRSTASSVSGSVLGKRDPSAASESEKDELSQPKRRRVAPIPVPQPINTARSVSQASTSEAAPNAPHAKK